MNILKCRIAIFALLVNLSIVVWAQDLPEQTIHLQFETTCADISSDGKSIVVGGPEPAVYDVSNGKIRMLFKNPGSMKVLTTHLSPDGTKVLGGLVV
jgi:WD40 repeat protein